MDTSRIAALTFDVFGTVADWRTSIIVEGRSLARRKGLDVDWEEFADRWRAGYGPAMDQVRRGDLAWTRLDDLHRSILYDLLHDFGIVSLSEEEIDGLNRVWHRLQPWPDVVPGLVRLKSAYVIATLSNGNVALLVNMAKHADLPWDCILSAELARHYKPDPEVYRVAADLLGVVPQRVLMVAAHGNDLRAAAAVGMKTAYVHRPTEHGEGKPKAWPAESFDVMVHDFIELAEVLGT